MSDVTSPHSSSPAGRHPDLFVGTYTERLPHVNGLAPGIMRAGYAGRGLLGETTLATVFRNPSWVTGFEGVLYAVSETHADEGQGNISAYRIDPDSHTLVLLGVQLSGGGDPAHLAVSPDGRHLVVANYSGGSVALFALHGETGRIGDRLDLAQHEGEGPSLVRQASPHPHMVAFDPHTQDVYIPDLGIDAVLGYRISEGRLIPTARIELPAGSGPRHLAFHPSGDVFFVVGELDNTLSTFRRGPSGFAAAGSVSLLPDDVEEPSSAAAVQVSPSGDLVFASNRGHDSVSVFRYGPGDALQLIASVPVLGRTPRDIVLTPDGQYLLAANQDSDSVTVFSVDEAATGPNVLSFVREHRVPTPVCLAWGR